MNINELNRPLTTAEIEFKPQSARIYDGVVYCDIVPYKSARVDMDILDNVCGPGKWQNSYERDSEKVLKGGIGILVDDRWIWKWSNGVKSNFEKEKGEYSDAFKRAGFMWGIGRCLYAFPHVRVVLNEKEYMQSGENAIKVTGYFKPNNWKWSLDWGDDEEKPFKLVGKQWIQGGYKERYNSNPNNAKNQKRS